MSDQKVIGSYIADEATLGANWLAHFPMSPPLNALKTGIEASCAKGLGLIISWLSAPSMPSYRGHVTLYLPHIFISRNKSVSMDPISNHSLIAPPRIWGNKVPGGEWQRHEVVPQDKGSLGSQSRVIIKGFRKPDIRTWSLHLCDLVSQLISLYNLTLWLRRISESIRAPMANRLLLQGEAQYLRVPSRTEPRLKMSPMSR